MTHQHDQPSGTPLLVAIGLNFLLSAVQVVGGVFSGSLALIADALHNTSDAISLVVAYVAQKIGRKPADEYRTFGYKKAETVAALVNITATIVTALYILIEASMRFLSAERVEGWPIIWISIVAIVVDFATVGLTYVQSKDSLNFKAVFLHNLVDGLASVGVLISGICILTLDIYWVDPLAALLISVFIVIHARKPLIESIRLLVDSVPEGVSLNDVQDKICSIEFVEGVHHLHIWSLSESRHSLEAHVVVKISNLSKIEAIKSKIKKSLLADFNIEHSTLEFEMLSGSECER